MLTDVEFLHCDVAFLELYTEGAGVSLGGALYFVCSVMVPVTAYAKYSLIHLFMPNKSCLLFTNNVKRIFYLCT